MTRSLGSKLLLTLTALGMPAAAAADKLHVVRDGESASSIARSYYGDYDATDLLLRYNDKQGTVIRPGERLRIPYSQVYRIRPGDSWSAIAERHLGAASGYPAVARLNGLAPTAPLRVGTDIRIPAILRYRLRRGDSLARLAELWYGNADLAGMLGSFNQIEDPRKLAVGDTLRIPFLAPSPPPRTTAAAPARSTPTARRQPATPPAPRPAKPSPPKTTGPAPAPAPPQERFGSQLRTARAAFDDGEYARARQLLESLREAVVANGQRDEQAELWELLSFVYVAFDLDDEACRAAREGRSGPLDHDLVSPKVRKVLERCRGG